jgi:hypothetical protein
MGMIQKFTNLTELSFQDMDLVATSGEEIISFLVRQILDQHR